MSDLLIPLLALLGLPFPELMAQGRPLPDYDVRSTAAMATAAVAAPSVVSAQGPISMRWQSTWPSKDIFHEFALDYAQERKQFGRPIAAFQLVQHQLAGMLADGQPHSVLLTLPPLAALWLRPAP